MTNVCTDRIKLLHGLLYGSKLYIFEINREILTLSIKFLKLSKRFDRPLC